ncbi:MAG TPA: MFS transporter, partial [Thermomicrobiales bacterium]|nr:MFS transporter [Thermomicrobiales bacterium]
MTTPGGADAAPKPPAATRWRLPRGFAAFRHRNYRLYFSGQLISITGTWIQTLAQSWLILSLTTSPLMLGLVSVCQFAPVLILGLIGGVAADRFPKRSVLVVTQSLFGLVSAAIAILIWTHTIQLWHVFALALLLGVVSAFDMPTRQAFVVEMVGPDDLTNAIALNSSVFNAARIVGPAIAGVLLATVGTAACFAIDAVSYIAVIAGLLMMRLESRPVAMAGSHLDRLREGLSYVRRTPNIYLPIFLIGLIATFGMNFNVWVPLLAKQDLDIGAGGFG